MSHHREEELYKEEEFNHSSNGSVSPGLSDENNEIEQNHVHMDFREDIDREVVQ